MAEFAELLRKIANNEKLAPIEMDELGRFGTETQRRNAFLAGNISPVNLLDIKFPIMPLYNETFQSDKSSFSIDLPQDYNHILLFSSGRGSLAVSSNIVVRSRFNNDTGANYAYQLHNVYDDINIYANNGTGFTYIDLARLAGASQPAGVSASSFSILLNYRSNLYKQILSLFGSVDASYTTIQTQSASWNSTSPISTISFFPESGTISAGSTFSIYGLK